jgi:eukaryotic-like serine/threonine-protein kinase
VTSLSDGALAHLRQVLERPVVPGGRYEILDVVGQGGMGTVYRARDVVLGREVALKVLRPETADEGLAERLRREARILARLEHPGIVPVHDVGTLADGRVFYVMKLVRGTRLDVFTEAAGVSEVLRIFLRVAETVGFGHARGVIHRDLKPANIMVGAFGEVLVLDWGIARIIGGGVEPDSSGVSEKQVAMAEGDTAPGSVLGTPGFMAPEQAQGEVHLVDARTDIYALGAILKTVLGDKAPRPLSAVAAKACAPEPAHRYGSAAEFAAEVTRYLDGQPVLAHRETLLERAGRLYARYQTPIILVLTYLAMRLLFLVVRRR